MWLEPDEWERVQRSVPIACVDVLPVQLDASGKVAAVGLILRSTPHQGDRWCLVGGRLFRNESLTEAAARQISTTLGDEVTFQLLGDGQPLFVAQYFTEVRPLGNHDPRQHAIGVTFCATISGQAAAQGEAARFQFFAVNQLPQADAFGFEQDRVVRQCIERLRNSGWTTGSQIKKLE